MLPRKGPTKALATALAAALLGAGPPLFASSSPASVAGREEGAAEAEPRESGLVETEVVVARGSKTPLDEAARRVEVIEGERLRREGVRSLPEALQLFPGLDVRRRGVAGVQADVSIRGASFEQLTVLVDGVPQNDPQTGHHHMDLPVPISAIERIEVLYGGGSSVWGAGAMGGAIHIVTRDPASAAGSLELFAGENSLSGGEGSFAFDAGALGAHRVSFSRAESGPYSSGNEFDHSLVRWDARHGRLSASLAGSRRDFGARNFYTTRFPDQYETTETLTARVGLSGEGALGQWRGDLSYRRHDDLFILDRFDPGLLTNDHVNETARLDFSATRELALDRLDYGVQVAEERIDSTNLGERARTRGQARAAWSSRRERLEWTLGASLEALEGELEAMPSLTAQRRLGRGQRLRASVARSFRVPSYTELHYSDPVTAGDPGLDPERAWSYELGWAWQGQFESLEIAAFLRDASELIDYVLEPGDTLFRVRNLRDVQTEGVEASWRRRVGSYRPLALSLSAAWLDARGTEPEGVSRYVFDFLRFRTSLTLRPVSPPAVDWSLHVAWNERNEADDYFRVDAALAYSPGRGPWRVWLRAENLLDERYVEQGAVEMPGRWVSLGISRSWQ